MQEQQGRANREEWAKRIERWRDSGLTAAEFAAELGLNARTLTYWKWMLGKEARGEKRVWPKRPRVARESMPEPASLVTPGLVEIATVPHDTRFEIELRCGHRLRVASSFDAAVLKRLLDVLEAR